MLAQQGYRPRRTIVFGSWDAEEYTLTGSTEWGEQYEKDLKQNAIVCINMIHIAPWSATTAKIVLVQKPSFFAARKNWPNA